jgi:peptidoglycan/xylan/chitin deacetylase (PgdA/CDA1 family)
MTGTRAVIAATVSAHLLPSVLTIPALSRRVAPALSGQTAGRHVALTFDDGPDPRSTPAVLAQLDELGVHATFFVLGTQVERAPGLAVRIAEAGHEIAVHGWTHRPHLLRNPALVPGDIGRTTRLITAVTGRRPRHWRPPNGILSGAGLLGAATHGLRPVLWTADGQDWRADATPTSIRARVTRQLDAGGVVLLHDSDITSASGSWRAVVEAIPSLVEHCAARGWPIGPLRDHFLPLR